MAIESLQAIVPLQKSSELLKYIEYSFVLNSSDSVNYFNSKLQYSTVPGYFDIQVPYERRDKHSILTFVDFTCPSLARLRDLITSEDGLYSAKASARGFISVHGLSEELVNHLKARLSQYPQRPSQTEIVARPENQDDLIKLIEVIFVVNSRHPLSQFNSNLQLNEIYCPVYAQSVSYDLYVPLDQRDKQVFDGLKMENECVNKFNDVIQNVSGHCDVCGLAGYMKVTKLTPHLVSYLRDRLSGYQKIKIHSDQLISPDESIRAKINREHLLGCTCRMNHFTHILPTITSTPTSDDDDHNCISADSETSKSREVVLSAMSFRRREVKSAGIFLLNEYLKYFLIQGFRPIFMNAGKDAQTQTITQSKPIDVAVQAAQTLTDTAIQATPKTYNFHVQTSIYQKDSYAQATPVIADHSAQATPSTDHFAVQATVNSNDSSTQAASITSDCCVQAASVTSDSSIQTSTSITSDTSVQAVLIQTDCSIQAVPERIDFSIQAEALTDSSMQTLLDFKDSEVQVTEVESMDISKTDSLSESSFVGCEEADNEKIPTDSAVTESSSTTAVVLELLDSYCHPIVETEDCNKENNPELANRTVADPHIVSDPINIQTIRPEVISKETKSQLDVICTEQQAVTSDQHVDHEETQSENHLVLEQEVAEPEQDANQSEPEVPEPEQDVEHQVSNSEVELAQPLNVVIDAEQEESNSVQDDVTEADHVVRVYSDIEATEPEVIQQDQEVDQEVTEAEQEGQDVLAQPEVMTAAAQTAYPPDVGVNVVVGRKVENWKPKRRTRNQILRTEITDDSFSTPRKRRTYQPYRQIRRHDSDKPPADPDALIQEDPVLKDHIIGNPNCAACFYTKRGRVCHVCLNEFPVKKGKRMEFFIHDGLDQSICKRSDDVVDECLNFSRKPQDVNQDEGIIRINDMVEWLEEMAIDHLYDLDLIVPIVEPYYFLPTIEEGNENVNDDDDNDVVDVVPSVKAGPSRWAKRRRNKKLKKEQENECHNQQEEQEPEITFYECV